MTIKLLDQPETVPPYIWLAEIGLKGSRVGIHSHDGWCFQFNGKTVRLQKEIDFIPLLPLLEVGRADLYDFLQKIEIKTGMNIEFPENQLMSCAFNTAVSDYWIEKALEWLRLSGHPVEILPVDFWSLSQQKNFSQKTRQKLSKLAPRK